VGASRRLGWRVKGAIAVGILGVIGLIGALVALAGARAIDHRVQALLSDTNTRPNNWTDWSAWNGQRATLLHVTDTRTLVVDDVWYGEAPGTEDLERIGSFASMDSIEVQDEDAAGDGKYIAPSRLLAFTPWDFQLHGGLAIVATDRVFECYYDPDNHNNDMGYRGRENGLYAVGSLADVKARALHIREVHRVFDEVKARRRLDLLDAFLRSHIGPARYDAIDTLKASPDLALRLFRAFLSDDEHLDGRPQAVLGLRVLPVSGVAHELALALEHELVFWEKVAPTLPALWRTTQGNLGQSVRRHYSVTCLILDGMSEHNDDSCREPVRRFLAVKKGMPPDGDDSRTLDRACERAQRLVLDKR